MAKPERLPKFTRVRFKSCETVGWGRSHGELEGVIIKGGTKLHRDDSASPSPSKDTKKVRKFTYTIQIASPLSFSISPATSNEATRLEEMYALPEDILEVLGEVDPKTLLADADQYARPPGQPEARKLALIEMLKEHPVLKCKLSEETGRSDGTYCVTGIKKYSSTYDCNICVNIERLDQHEDLTHLTTGIDSILWDTLEPMSAHELLTTASGTAQRAAFDEKAAMYTEAAKAVEDTFSHLDESWGRLFAHVERIIARKRLLGTKLSKKDPKRIAAYHKLDVAGFDADLEILKQIRTKHTEVGAEIKKLLLTTPEEIRDDG